MGGGQLPKNGKKTLYCDTPLVYSKHNLSSKYILLPPSSKWLNSNFQHQFTILPMQFIATNFSQWTGQLFLTVEFSKFGPGEDGQGPAPHKVGNISKYSMMPKGLGYTRNNYLSNTVPTLFKITAQKVYGIEVIMLQNMLVNLSSFISKQRAMIPKKSEKYK